MELVEVKNNRIFTDSLKFAEKFGIAHRNLMITIRELSAVGVAPENYFFEDTFINKQGREYSRFLMSEEGFMFLVMNTKAKPERMKEIWRIQILFIEAFKKMQEKLLKLKNNQENIEWKKTREQGKNIRLELTDTIKDFVEYAFSQGSSNAKRYYSNITKMEYKALGLMEQKNPKLRDVLDTMELYQILMAEDLVKRQLKKYMEKELHYKEIYLLIKQDVENFAKGLMIGGD